MFNNTVSALTLIIDAEKIRKHLSMAGATDIQFPKSPFMMLLIHDTARQGQSLAINLKVLATDEGSFALLAQSI